MTPEENDVYVLIIGAPKESKNVYLGDVGRIAHTMVDGRKMIRFPQGKYKYSGETSTLKNG